MDLLAARPDTSHCTELLQHTLEEHRTTERLLTQITVMLRKAGIRQWGECRELAHDLAQSALAQAWGHRLRYDATRGEPGGWLYGIAVNVVRDFLKKRRRLPIQWPLHDKSFEHLLEAVPGEDDLPPPIDIVEILDRFSVVDQELIQLFFLEQRSQVEIADMLHIKAGTLRTRLTRLRRHLREIGQRTLRERAS